MEWDIKKNTEGGFFGEILEDLSRYGMEEISSKELLTIYDKEVIHAVLIFLLQEISMPSFKGIKLKILFLLVNYSDN